MPTQPQDHKQPARKTAAAQRREQKKMDKELDRGVKVKDTDGTVLQVRLRDVKGIHDARLVEIIGLDFVGLLEAMSRRQGLDLFAATLWFARLVNGRGLDSDGRPTESYRDLLEHFGYEDFIALGLDEPTADGDAPKASAGSSVKNSQD